MQQYRVNFTLLIAIAVGTLICSGAVYGLWRFQIERKSGWLLQEAEKSREESDFRNAAQFYGQYLSIHPENNEVRLKLANMQADLARTDDAGIEDLRNAIGSLESTLRDSSLVDLPEGKKLRRRLIDIYGRDNVRNYSSALDHINLMLDSDPSDAELQVQRAMYLAKSGDLNETVKYSYQLIGYDPKSDTFDAKKATAPKDAQVYSTLAAIIRTKEDRPELAERIIDQLVEVNPESAAAYLTRGRVRMAWGNAEGGRADAEKALQLKPEDIDVLLFNADLAARDEQFEKAQGFIDTAKKLHPEEVRVYHAAAGLQINQKQYDKALAEIEEGMGKVSAAKKLELLFFKVELQIPQQDVKGARETIEELQKARNLRPDVLDYFEARIMLVEGKWFQAMEAFNKLAARASDFGRDRAAEINYSLGLCHERLGRLDMAKEQYQQVLNQQPQNAPALAGIQRVEAQLDVKKSEGRDPLQEAIAEEIKKPKPEQNWKKVDELIDKIVKEREMDPTSILLIKAQVLLMREDYDGAAKLVAEAKQLSPDSLQVDRAIVQLARFNPKVGPAQALELLKKVTAQHGDKPALRLDKADLLIAINKDKQDREPLKQELASLLAGIDAWTGPQKVELWTGMAGRYLSLNMPEEARQNLSLAADNQTDELPLAIALFSLALDAGDDAGMKEAQDRILKIVGNTNDSAWLYTEARRKLMLVSRGRLGPEELSEIRSLANQALQQRPTWHELHALLGEVELRSNNVALAINHYDKAEQLGRPAPSAVAAHIRLLAAVGRYRDAGKLIDRIPESARQAMLGPLYAEILFRDNQVEAALKQALAATEADPNNAQNHYWYAQLLARSSQDSKITEEQKKATMLQAIKSMQRAAELQPEFPEAWFAIINYFMLLKDEAQAQKTLRDAQLVLSGDNLPAFLARSYEVLHRWFDAETMYRAMYEAAPDDLSRVQQLAAFYVGPLYQLPDRAQKVTPLINQILKAGADKKVPPNDPNLLWARRTAARFLSTTGEYPKLVDAEKLLASNSRDGSLMIEDKLAMAEILANRHEPVSKVKAIGLLEDVSKIQPLNEKAEIVLGELYYATSSDWQKYARQMDKTIGVHPTSVAAREAYARKLLFRGDERALKLATAHVTKMRELAPSNPTTFELTVRLAGKLGKQKPVIEELKRRLPDIQNIKELTDAQTQYVSMLASLLVELGDLDTAEKIYRDLAAKNPKHAYALASFLGKYRSPEQAFEKLNEIYSPQNIPDILTVALSVVRDRRDKVGDKFDAQIDRWMETGLRENPDSIQLLMMKADLFDLLKKYDEAADLYRKLVARDDLTGIRRAIVLNNASFLLALAGPAAASDADPLKFVQEAAQILGPNADILDTRAVVLTSRKQYKEAISDLELSVTDNPTASKYYHKAVAHFRAGQNRDALAAWQKAEALGLGREALNRMEYEQYDEMKTKIDQIRGGRTSVTSAEPARKAG